MHGIHALPRAPASLLLVACALAACAGGGSSPGGPASSAPLVTTDPATRATDDLDDVVAITIAHTGAGDALAGPNGKTLYIRTKDQDGTSTCTTGACAEAWGALVGDASKLQIEPGVSGTFGMTIWGDGTQQLTHNGQPLYFYSKDAAAGDARGEGSGGVWCIAPITANAECEFLTPAEEWNKATFRPPGPAIRAAESAEDY